MEDFGYQRDNIEGKFSHLGKKIFLIAATLFSISCFIYITISAYHFVYQEENSNIEIVKGPDTKIKIIPDNTKEKPKMAINNSIYEDIFGNNLSNDTRKAKIRDIPKPAIPPKTADIDRRLIKSPPSNKKTTSKKPKAEKIIIYSDKKDNKNSNKDLLTKNNGKKAVKTNYKSQKRAVRVQIAAMTSKKAAQKSWNILNKSYPKLFANLKPFVQKVNLGSRGIFFRLQIGNFYNQVEAEKFCNLYIIKAQKSRADCIIVE